MTKVYLLHHVHEFDDGHEDVKLIGVFRTFEKAQETMEGHKKLEGFRDYIEGFSIDECTLDRVGWTEGFITY